jgi:endonuclease-3
VASKQFTYGQIRKTRTLLEKRYGRKHWKCWGKGVDVLVETILSQNTSDVNSTSGYKQLGRRFRSWNQVLEAPVEEVERHIRVSGLSKIKAPRIQFVLRRIKREHGKIDLEFLKEWESQKAYEYLLSFPGVGPKTAYCVLMFSFGMKVFPVDTHIHRIAKRVGWISEKTNADKAHLILTQMIAPDDRYAMHLLLIEHGRKTCKAGRPLCEKCTLLSRCDYGRERLTRPGVQGQSKEK